MTKTLYVMRARRYAESRYFVGPKPMKLDRTYHDIFTGSIDDVSGHRRSLCRQFLEVSGLKRSMFPRGKNVLITLKVGRPRKGR